MIILHGGWCPHPANSQGGQFYLWAETLARPTQPKRGRPARLSTGQARPHPGQISTRQVRVAWQRLAPQVVLPAVESPAVVWLPSREGWPEPAPELQLLEEEPASGEAVLAAWEIGCIALPAGQALGLLAVLPETTTESWNDVALGSDLHYWSLAAKLALEALARQQYLPAVLDAGDGSYWAAWVPYLDPAGRARVSALARAMPPVCRAMAPQPARARPARVTPANLLSPAALLDSFLAAAVDGSVRCWAASRRPPQASSRDRLARHWHDLLLEPPAADGSYPALKGSPAELRDFYERYQSWVQQVAPTGDGAFRICFRLEPPEAEGEATASASPRTGQPDKWALRYFLQASDDPSLLVPAEMVWREAGNSLRYLSRRFDQPQERLLSGLGRAARIFPAMEKSLQAAHPSTSRLSTAEAYTFLRESAPLLESAGFGLLVPPWWKRRGARLGLRLRVSPGQASTSSGILGLESLVKYDWQISLGDESLSQEEFIRLASLKVPLVQVRGQWVEMRAEQIEAILRFWREQERKPEHTLAEALRLVQALEHDGETPLPIAGVDAEGWMDDLLQQLSGREPLSLLPPPNKFCGQLRPYQVSGVSWLAFMHRWGLGTCLADDMGLGKTIQVLALLLADREQGAPRPASLLICPTSAVGNWQREAARFAPDLRVLVHHGLERRSGAEFTDQVAQHDLVVSSYNLLYRDEETLAAVEWDGVILDEAQNIKNAGTRQAQAARRLPARYRVALTGTPVENRLAELWSIVDFINPGYLGGQNEFRRHFALPIERYQDPAALQQLRSLVRPFILRRVKSDPQVIQDLPEKLEIPVYCKLTQEQATLYQAAVTDAMEKIAATEGIERRGLVLAMLLKLKQICNHPAQFLGDGSSLPGRSGKLARLTEMLEEVIAAGDRALVFTQFSEMGELLRRHLQAELHHEVLFLHGGVPQPQRERMVRRFQEGSQGPPIFILSLKAGGTALNLMRANHVFHFDRWWNPAVENQATDRAYRIGQTRNVLVHKFTCLGTVEERIAELIESKKALAENVIDSGEGWLTELSTEELRELLVLRQDAVE